MPETLSPEFVLYEVKGPVAWLTLNRPKVLNALNELVLRELDLAIGRLSRDAEILCAVITGAGDKAFAAGGRYCGHGPDDPGAGPQLRPSGPGGAQPY